MTRNPTIEPITAPTSPSFSQLAALQALLWLITPDIDEHEPLPPTLPPRPRRRLTFQSIPLRVAPHLTHIPNHILPAAPTKKSQASRTLEQSDVSVKPSKKEKFERPQKQPTYPRHPYHLIPLLPLHTAPPNTEPSHRRTPRLCEYTPQPQEPIGRKPRFHWSSVPLNHAGRH